MIGNSTIYSKLCTCHRKRIYTEQKAKVFAAVWGMYCIWMPHYCIYSSSWFEQKFWGDNLFKKGSGLVWCETDDIHFSKASILQVAVILFILFFKSSWRKKASVDSVPKQQRWPLLLFCLYPSSMIPVHFSPGEEGFAAELFLPTHLLDYWYTHISLPLPIVINISVFLPTHLLDYWYTPISLPLSIVKIIIF